MMNDTEFIQAIKKATGKDLGIHYGFIAGTHHPIMSNTGALSAVRQQGYILWKRAALGIEHESKNIIPRDQEHSLNEIIEFLKD